MPNDNSGQPIHRSLGEDGSPVTGHRSESEDAADHVLFMPPIDESDVSLPAVALANADHQPASPELEAELPKSEGGSASPKFDNEAVTNQSGSESAAGAGDVLIVPPVDESEISLSAGALAEAGHEPAAPELGADTATGEGRAYSTEGEQVPAPTMEEVRAAIEAILYAAGEPVTIRELKKAFSDTDPDDIKNAIAGLLEVYNTEGRGLQIVEVAGGFQITTRPEYHDRVSSIFKFKPPSRLSIQALETLATIAYRQPVTVPEIMELRGVHSAGVVRTLLEKKLIRILGRKNVVGRPLLYGTTKEFLTRFGLKDMSELPRLEDMAEVFGEDVALQLEEVLGEKDTSAASPVGSSDGSRNGGGSVETGEASVNQEVAAGSDASPIDEGEAEQGDREE